MKLLTGLLILLAAVSTRCTATDEEEMMMIVVEEEITPSPTTIKQNNIRSKIEVTYEYRLEVKNVQSRGTTTDVLQDIDNTILVSLQDTIPNGKSIDGIQEPNVKFELIQSNIFSACFTKSEQCSLIRSTILVSYEGEKPQNAVEKVTLKLVQDYLNDLTETESTTTLLTYMYPSAVSTLVQLQFHPVESAMDKNEIQVMEDTFLEVFGAIVAAIEGDTVIQDAQFLYQDLHYPTPSSSSSSSSQSHRRTTNLQLQITPDTVLMATDFLVTGYCRDCTSNEFGNVVNTVVAKNLEAFQLKLNVNGELAFTSYFQVIQRVAFVVPQLPTTLPPIQDESIFDSKPPVVNGKPPTVIFIGVGLYVLIVSIGCYLVKREQESILRAEEEEISPSTSESDEEGNDDDEYARGNDDDDDDDDEEEDDSNPTRDEDSELVDEYEEASGIVYSDMDQYQVETIAPSSQGEQKSDNYGLYVF